MSGHVHDTLWGSCSRPWTWYNGYPLYQHSAYLSLPPPHPKAFRALTLLVGRQEGHPACKKTERWGSGVVICLERGSDLHMAQLMPLPLTVSLLTVKSILVLPLWYRLTWVFPDKRAVKRARARARVCEHSVKIALRFNMIRYVTIYNYFNILGLNILQLFIFMRFV